MSGIVDRLTFSAQRLVATVLVLGAATVSVIAPAAAQCASPPPVNPATMAQFNNDPNAYLSNIAPGGALVGAVRNLAVSDPSIAAKITSFATANPSTKGDVGTGLGQAAKICAPSQSTQAQSLQQAVLALNDPVMMTSFLAVAGDIATTATGGGGAGGGGAGGGPGGAGINAAVGSAGTSSSFTRNTATSTTTNGVFSFSPGSSPSVTTTNTITSAATLASP